MVRFGATQIFNVSDVVRMPGLPPSRRMDADKARVSRFNPFRSVTGASRCQSKTGRNF